MTLFVPLGEPLEVWLVKLRNLSDRPRDLSLLSYFEWLLGVAPDWHREFHRTFIETRFHATLGAILAYKHLWEVSGRELSSVNGGHWNRSWNYIAFHAVSPSPAGFECEKEAFLGMYGSVQSPLAVAQGRTSQIDGRWGDPVGSLRVDISLAPGEEKAIIFTLGVVEEASKIEGLITKYRDVMAVEGTLAEVKKVWRELLSPLQVKTPDRAFDIMNNIWLKYQVISGRLWGRTAYYQIGGAYGFRDQLQDSQVFLLIDRPDLAEKQIRLHARHQFRDGTVCHWWHPVAETGAATRVSDDLLWLPFVIINYLKETADFAILNEVEPYLDGGEGSLYDHCQRAIDKVLDRFSPWGASSHRRGGLGRWDE